MIFVSSNMSSTKNLEEFQKAFQSIRVGITEDISKCFNFSMEKSDKLLAYLFGLSDFKGKIIASDLVVSDIYTKYKFVLLLVNKYQEVLYKNSFIYNSEIIDGNELVVQIKLNIDRFKSIAESIFNICIAHRNVVSVASKKKGITLNSIKENESKICEYLNKDSDYLKKKLLEINKVFGISIVKLSI